MVGKDPQHPLNRRTDVPRAGLMLWTESKSLASAKKQTANGPAQRPSLYWMKCQRKKYPILWKLTIIPFADVLGLYKLQDKTVFFYIHTLQSQILFTYVLGLGNLQYKIILCYSFYVTLSVSSWQYLSQYWQAL